MSNKTHIVYFIATLFLVITTSLQAGSVTIPNNFTSGTPAVAAEVNGNFSAFETAVDDNDSRITALENTIATLQSNLANVMALNAYLMVNGTDVTLSGINLHIDNGMGGTRTINGLGNVIIGYDEVNSATTVTRCSNGIYNNQINCESNGEIWSSSHKTGSHYLVLGSENNYSQYGGLVAGYQSFATGLFSTVTGGDSNTASGYASSVSGGSYNLASGGTSNVSGGDSNAASGPTSNVSGGMNNIAGGFWSSVSGGLSNIASGSFSNVSGGYSNTAGGESSSVSGGSGRGVTGPDDWAAGSLFEDL